MLMCSGAAMPAAPDFKQGRVVRLEEDGEADSLLNQLEISTPDLPAFASTMRFGGTAKAE